MIFGIDPVDLMVFLMAGLIGVIGAMFIIMFRMVRLLEGIRSESKIQSGHLKAITGPVAPLGATAAEFGSVHLGHSIS